MFDREAPVFEWEAPAFDWEAPAFDGRAPMLGAIIPNSFSCRLRKYRMARSAGEAPCRTVPSQVQKALLQGWRI